MSKKYAFRKQFTFEGKRYNVEANTEQELFEKLTLKKKALEEGTYIVESHMLLKDWIDICYKNYKTNVRDITLKREYNKCRKWLIEPLGNMQISKIKPLHLQGVLNQLFGYSAAFQKDIHRIIKWVFNLAVQNGLIAQNPALNLTRPQSKPAKKRRELTPYEREHFLKVCDEDPLMRYFLVMLFCGLRPSEAQELKFMDIDCDNKLMHIRGKKTAAADRFVPVSGYMLDRLPEGDPFDYVFKSASGNKINENTSRVLWKRLRRNMNISMGCKVFRNELIPPYPFDESITPYHLRHTFCTDLCKAGVDLRIAKDLMGHSDISLTANIYTHTDKNMISDAGQKLEDLAERQQKMMRIEKKQNLIPSAEAETNIIRMIR